MSEPMSAKEFLTQIHGETVTGWKFLDFSIFLQFTLERDAAIRAQERQACADRVCKECRKTLNIDAACNGCTIIKTIKGETP